jgi:hypothetical protein
MRRLLELEKPEPTEACDVVFALAVRLVEAKLILRTHA